MISNSKSLRPGYTYQWKCLLELDHLVLAGGRRSRRISYSLGFCLFHKMSFLSSPPGACTGCLRTWLASWPIYFWSMELTYQRSTDFRIRRTMDYGECQSLQFHPIARATSRLLSSNCCWTKSSENHKQLQFNQPVFWNNSKQSISHGISKFTLRIGGHSILACSSSGLAKACSWMLIKRLLLAQLNICSADKLWNAPSSMIRKSRMNDMLSVSSLGRKGKRL